MARRSHPNKLYTLQKRLARKIRKEYRALKGEIREYLKNPTQIMNYEFTGSFEEYKNFQDWLDGRLKEIYESVSGTLTNNIELAYVKSVEDAKNKLKKAGADDALLAMLPELTAAEIVPYPPQVDNAIKKLQSRSLAQLEGINSETGKEIKRIIADRMQPGASPYEIAAALNDRVDKISITRATALARTETANAHIEATLDMFEEARVEEVDVIPEVLLGSDPCEICESLAKKTWTIKEARKQYPVHPYCECTLVPKVRK